MAYGFAPITLTANTTLDRDYHANGPALGLNAAAGLTVTLPAAVGSGDTYFIRVAALASSGSYVIKVASATDFFVGEIMGSRTDSGNAVLGFCAANSGTVSTNSDTITLNRSTTGSVNVGEWIQVQDVASATWQVSGMLTATGAAFATPFSAAV